MRELSIVIVDYKKASLIVENLLSIPSKYHGYLEVVVIDNSLSDENFSTLLSLKENLPFVNLIQQSVNIGYSAGVNAAVNASTKKNVLILSPDVQVNWDEDFWSLVEKISEKNIGVIGVRQLEPGGQSTEIIREFSGFSTLVKRRLSPKFSSEKSSVVDFPDLDPRGVYRVPWMQSSFYLMRREVWDEIGGMDERFYIFMADEDYCARLHQHGYRVLYVGNYSCASDGVRASRKGGLFPSKVEIIHIQDALKFELKYSMNKKMLSERNSCEQVTF